jgi:hypothetical protein
VIGSRELTQIVLRGCPRAPQCNTICQQRSKRPILREFTLGLLSPPETKIIFALFVLLAAGVCVCVWLKDWTEPALWQPQLRFESKGAWAAPKLSY